MPTKKISFSPAASSNTALKDVFAKDKELSGQKQSMIRICDISFDKEFQEMFKKNDEVVKDLTAKMQSSGFDKLYPVLMAKIQDEGILVPLDGHTRIHCAQLAGITEIPYVVKTFETRKTALLYALELQTKLRRNLSTGEKISALEKIDEILNPGKKKNNYAKTAKEAAEQLGVSPRQVEKMRSVIKNGDKKLIKEVKENKKTVRQAYEEIHGNEKKLSSEFKKGLSAGIAYMLSEPKIRPDSSKFSLSTELLQEIEVFINGGDLSEN